MMPASPLHRSNQELFTLITLRYTLILLNKIHYSDIELEARTACVGLCLSPRLNTINSQTTRMSFAFTEMRPFAQVLYTMEVCVQLHNNGFSLTLYIQCTLIVIEVMKSLIPSRDSSIFRLPLPNCNCFTSIFCGEYDYWCYSFKLERARASTGLCVDIGSGIMI